VCFTFALSAHSNCSLIVVAMLLLTVALCSPSCAVKEVHGETLGDILKQTDRHSRIINWLEGVLEERRLNHGLRARFEMVLTNLTAEKLNLADVNTPMRRGEGLAAAIKLFAHNLVEAMYVHRFGIFQIAHSAFLPHNVDALLLPPRFLIEEVHSVAFAAQQPPMCARASTALMSLGILTKMRLYALIADVNQHLFDRGAQDTLALRLWEAMCEFERTRGQARVVEPDDDELAPDHELPESDAPPFRSRHDVLLSLVQAMSGELASFALKMLGKSPKETAAAQVRAELLTALSASSDHELQTLIERLLPRHDDMDVDVEDMQVDDQEYEELNPELYDLGDPEPSHAQTPPAAAVDPLPAQPFSVKTEVCACLDLELREQLRVLESVTMHGLDRNGDVPFADYFKSFDLKAHIMTLESNDLVGFAISGMDGRNKIFLYELHIDAKHRGNGYARVLLGYVQRSNTSRSASATTIDLNVHKLNANARDFYKYIGFGEIGETSCGKMLVMRFPDPNRNR
jgi:ribosomal protein S18 acetylase RimI-like enzyme